ncbi:hypothetical protein SAMN05421770_104251 [Granulicella rosea]|uniref:Uncharacterized protein n=1 Tax=Granulicella rosea TaxID=474952 RepID=A0A239K416_9BACT|nr:hypothetical protein [Granulicella rosea]SNT11904.1 hypothetical protein SAMN05421770_104251 [Granulicella rosea]
MPEDNFGFGGAAVRSTADKLRAIRPAEVAPPLPVMDRIDAIADSHGFTSREASAPSTSRPPVYRRKRQTGPTIPITTRLPERVAAAFIGFCEENRLAYWEGIEEMMKRLDIPCE